MKACTLAAFASTACLLAPVTPAHAQGVSEVPPAFSAPVVPMQTMVWSDEGASVRRLVVGLGSERYRRLALHLATQGSPASATPGSAGPVTESAVLVGVGLQLGASRTMQTRLTWQTSLLTSRGEGDPGAASFARYGALGTAPDKMRVGLTFAKQDPYAALRRAGALKLELGSQTSLALRPRRGKVSVTLMSQW